MANFIIAGFDNTPETLASGETGFITTGGTLVVNTGVAAITGSGVNALTVAGSILSSGTAYDFDGSVLDVSIGPLGYVSTTNGDAFAINATSSVDFHNAGTIQAGSDGVDMRSTSGSSASMNIENSGTITGHSDAIVMGPEGSSGRVVNSGTLNGVTGFGIATDVASSDAAAVGLITVINTGTIMGEGGSINTPNSAMLIQNTGDMIGNILFSTRADIYQGSGGVLEGTLIGNGGNDQAYGGQNDDRFFGGADNDSLVGGGGADELAGDTGLDTLRGGAGDDFAAGGDDNDLLSGGSGEDILNGEGASDTVFGDAGDDTVSGGAGNDTLLGGSGSDRIIGGTGRDSMTGGDGPDEFVYTTPAESQGAATADRIVDFQSGVDVLDFAVLNAGDIAYVGLGAFTGGGTASVRYQQGSTGNAIVLVDNDGNGIEDMRIILLNVPTLTIEDFIL